MGNRIEAAKNYMANLALRTVGLEAAKAYWTEHKPSPDNIPSKSSKKRALFYSAERLYTQVVSPLTHRELANEDKQRETAWKLNQPYKYSPRETVRLSVSTAVDAGLIYAAWHITQNPIGAIALKLAINAASNAGIDAAGTVANRIRNRRPSKTTLAV